MANATNARRKASTTARKGNVKPAEVNTKANEGQTNEGNESTLKTNEGQTNEGNESTLKTNEGQTNEGQTNEGNESTLKTNEGDEGQTEGNEGQTNEGDEGQTEGDDSDVPAILREVECNGAKYAIRPFNALPPRYYPDREELPFGDLTPGAAFDVPGMDAKTLAARVTTARKKHGLNLAVRTVNGISGVYCLEPDAPTA